MFGLALLIGFLCYLRPGELVQLRVTNLIEPCRGAGTISWAILIAPFLLGRTSKTKQFDESVLLDPPELRTPGALQALRRLLTAALARSPTGGSLWPFDLKQFESLWQRVVELSGVARLAPHLYSLRHGGASFDMLTKRRKLAEIKDRGRWRADASVTRYKKEALILQEVAKLSEQTRAFGMRVERDLGLILEGKMKVMLPKLLPRLRAAAVVTRIL